MDDDCKNIDHYSVLGLASGEEGAKLSADEISTAYRRKARELHPDKNPLNNPDDFLRLHSSYMFLKDTKKRKAFDAMFSKRRKKDNDVPFRRHEAPVKEYRDSAASVFHVLWSKSSGVDYGCQELRVVFSEFGTVDWIHIDSFLQDPNIHARAKMMYCKLISEQDVVDRLQKIKPGFNANILVWISNL